MSIDNEPITEDEVKTWCSGTMNDYTITYLTDILNKEYDLDEAIEDLLSFRKKDE